MPVTSFGDPRMRPWTYLTDETSLFEVIDAHEVTDAFKRPEIRVWVEDVVTGKVTELDANFSGMKMRLVEADEQPTEP